MLGRRWYWLVRAFAIVPDLTPICSSSRATANLLMQCTSQHGCSMLQARPCTSSLIYVCAPTMLRCWAAEVIPVSKDAS